MSSPLPTGTMLGRYQIQSLIGTGGMGDVYLATDSRINRNVAVKVLPAALREDADRLRRFEQEAKAAAALNHPNIAHIYEIGESGDLHYIAMEFIDGQTLRKSIHSEKVDIHKLLRYLQHVAEGLAKAHAAGIIHRDLKPDNIMITRDGFAKILDFGLAKLVEPQRRWGLGSDDATATLQQYSRPGVILGTVGYMSPEQAQGKTDQIDQRSDVFSFGCILYEAITGHRAFEGKDSIDTLNKIIREPPAPIQSIRRDASADLQKMARRCLEKDPDDRYQSIKDVAIDLRDLRREMGGTELNPLTASIHVSTQPNTEGAPGQTVPGANSLSTHASSAEYISGEIKRHKAAAAIIAAVLLLVIVTGIVGLRRYSHSGISDLPIDSIAVLPFVNQNNDPESEYQTDGLTESIINSLAQLPDVRVIARSSVFRYKGRQTDPLTAGKELGVRAVLTGRIMQRGENLEVSTELLDVRDNQQLWGERYSEKVSDLLSVQRTIADAITSNLRLKLSPPEQSRLIKNYTNNSEAYQLYLRGRFHWNKRTGESLEKAVDYFNQAIAKDPNYAMAYAGLADAWFSRGWYRYFVPKEAYERARSAATRALELDNRLAEAHTILAAIKTTYDWDWQGAEREFRLAIQMNPNYATAHQRYSLYLPITGRFDEAIAEAQKARDLDPLSLPVNENVGDILYLARRYDEAVEQLRKTMELDPNFVVAHTTLSKVYEAKGLYEEAVNERARVSTPEIAAQLKKAFATSGIQGFWRYRLDQLLERAKREYVSPADIAILYARVNDKDKAFYWLERAMEERSILFNYLVADARFDNIRSDPRFDDLLRRVGLK